MDELSGVGLTRAKHKAYGYDLIRGRGSKEPESSWTDRRQRVRSMPTLPVYYSIWSILGFKLRASLVHLRSVRQAIDWLATLLSPYATMHTRSFIVSLCLSLSACSALGRCSAPPPLSLDAFEALYTDPLPKPPSTLKVFHLGHSLVGRDMPAMLQQLAPQGHQYDSQLGWGTALRAHWEPDVEINGFKVENDHPRYRDAKEALRSGEYDALVITEMISLRDAVRYFSSWDYARRWARLAHEGNPKMRVYLYETWHNIDEGDEDWLKRVDRDLGELWEGEILRRAVDPNSGLTIYLIPAGQVLERLVREIENGDGLEGLKRREDLFSDTIHFNDIGAYVVALTHYAVLYQRSPVGLPHQLRRANGEFAVAPSEAAARRMQEIVWEVVTSLPRTGVPQVGAHPAQ